MSHVDDLLAAVREIEPTLREYAPQAEQDRRLAAPAVQALRDTGLFRMWRPKALGGLELDPVSGFRVFEEVSRIDSAAGWCLQISCAFDALGAWFPEDGAQDIWGAPEAVIAGSFNPMRKAVVVDGGHRVSGLTPFVSGAHHATWYLGLAVVHDGDTPRTDEQGNACVIATACPASEAEIVANWDTMGMRGTGSHDVRMTDIIVPAQHTVRWVPLQTPGPAYGGPLYRLTIWPSIAALTAPALGIARAAIEDATALATRKTPAYVTRSLKDRPVVHRELALAQAALDSSRAYLYKVFDELYAKVESGAWPDVNDKARAQLASTYAIQAAARAVQHVHEIAGASGFRETFAFERHFRDVHVITQHGFTNAAKLESVGQVMLGLDPEWPFFDF